MTALSSVDKIRRLMPTERSRSFNPHRLAREAANLEGTLLLSDMRRVDGLLAEYGNAISYQLLFGYDDLNRLIIDIQIEGEVMMICQRCMKPFQINLTRKSTLGLAGNNELMKVLPAEYEPLLIKDDLIDVGQLVEDELLLALPIAPMHFVENCEAKTMLTEVNDGAKKNPFATLKDLKKEK